MKFFMVPSFLLLLFLHIYNRARIVNLYCNKIKDYLVELRARPNKVFSFFYTTFLIGLGTVSFNRVLIEIGIFQLG